MPEIPVRLAPKRVPVSVFTTDGVLPTFAVATLCGRGGGAGMTNTPDLEIVMRRALTHAEECVQCGERWAQLSTPGTAVSTG